MSLTKVTYSMIQGTPTNVEDYGAVGDGTTNDRAAFNNALTNNLDVYIPGGEYVIGTSKLGEYQKPLNVFGEGADTKIIMGDDNVDDTIFRVGAVGGEFYAPRAITQFSNLTFLPPDGVTPPYTYTGIDMQACHPTVIRDVVMIGMGLNGLKLKNTYYGYVQGLYMANSGVKLEDVNDIEFSGGDHRPAEFDDPSRGKDYFGIYGYPVQLLSCNSVKFTATVFEGWDCIPIHLQRSDDITFNGSWFEGNTGDYVIYMEQAQSLELNSCRLDAAIPYTDCFIKVQNQTPIVDDRVLQTTFVKISGGKLLLMSIGYGYAPEFVKNTAGEPVRVLIEGVTFEGGNLFGSQKVEFDVRSMAITGQLTHSFYSLPNAQLLPAFNQWMPNSVSADWDFSGGANITAVSAGLVVSTSTASGTYMTGTKSAKIAGILSDNTPKQFKRTTTGEMGAVTVNNQTYYVFARVKCDQSVTFNFNINGGFLNFAGTPDVELPANTWRDFVFKTQANTTWAQGRFGTPSIEFYVTNNSGTTANFYIDRLDYQIVTGDIDI